MTKIEYYSSDEFRKKIKQSILKNGEQLKKDIKSEKECIVNKTNRHA